MSVSTIQLSKETKTLIGSFGTKEDSYETIIKKMYKMAVKEQSREFLMFSDKSLSLLVKQERGIKLDGHSR